MLRRNYNRYNTRPNYKGFYARLLNKIIIVLSILIIVLIIKTINNSTSNNMIEIIEKNIYYEFSWKSDGKRVVEYVRRVMGNTMESIEIFNME